MSLIPIGFIEATAKFTIANSPNTAQVVTGHENVGSLSAAAAAQVLYEDIWGAATGFRSVMTNEITLTQVEVRSKIDAGDPTVAAFSGTLLGLQGGVAVPAQVTYLVQKISGFAGRRNRGRMYIPGAPETTVNSGGFLTGTQTGLLATAAANFFTACNTEGLPLVILHTEPPDTATDVVLLAASNKVATQRRRVR